MIVSLKKYVRYRLLRTMVLVTVLFAVSGCGDFFAQRPTEIQSRNILEELGEVRESPNINNPLPEAYRQPTSRLEIKDGVKVFYFTKHHPAADLAALVQQQLGVKSTINTTTNQIVAFCADNAEADAVQGYLELTDICPIQVNVDCLILERFGDVTMDWETTLLVEDILTQNRLDNVGLGNVIGAERLEDQLTLGEIKFPNPAFPGASLRESERSNFGLDFGFWVDQGIDGEQIRGVVDVLVSRGYLKILLNPKLETVNGEKATITIKDYAPIEEVKTGSAGASGVYNITKYVWVENTLSVIPFVYSDGSVSLDTDIRIGSRSKPEGVVQRSIITERSIDVDENRIAPGKSLVIGGMRKSEKRSVIRGIPFLKDLPLLGILFSSKDFEEKGTEIIFILTPSISSGGVENIKVVENIRNKYQEPEYKKGFTDMITEPLGKDPYTKAIEQEAAENELQRVEAELDLKLAQEQLDMQRGRADLAEAEAERLQLHIQELQQLTEQIRQQVRQAAEQTKNTRTQAQTDQKTIQELQELKEKITGQMQQAQQDAEKAASQASQARRKAQEAQERIHQVQQQLEQAPEKPAPKKPQ